MKWDMCSYHGNMFSNQDQEDKSSLEAATQAAAKVNAMLIAKGMLKPNQIHSGTNVITKKAGGPNSLVVAEVEINNLTTPCRNTLTRGTTQEEISKASGAAVTTRGRYMAPDEKARNPRDRCLYLNVQAATKESVDVAVQKINEIIKSMCGDKVDQKNRNMNSNRGGRMRSPFRMNMGNNRFNLRGPPPPPLMSLPTPPPPIVHQMPPMSQPVPQTMTILQENLYIGLEHAPPNFDTKNKMLGPGGSFLHHIQVETGAHVSLRGRASGYLDLNGADSFEPMHVHIEHGSLFGLQEAKKLAENLIQTVQQSYVSFQQALAALPASIPTGLITGVPQQSPYVEAHLAAAQPGLATISALTEQSLHAMQTQVQHLGPRTMLLPSGSMANQLPPMPQALSNTATCPAMVLPSNLSLTPVPLVSTMPVSAASMLPQQSAHLELGGHQQRMILSQQPPPQAQTITQVSLQQLVHGPPPTPQPIPAPLPTQLGAYTHVQPTMQLVSQTSIAPPTLIHQQGLIAQHPQTGQHILAPQGLSSAIQFCLEAGGRGPHPSSQPGSSISLSAPTSLVYTMASSGPYYTSPKLEEPKRRFREEKDDKIPENLLGYQHGPPHLVNLVRSSPPPQSMPPPISQGLVPHPGAQLVQASHHGLFHLSHMTPEQSQFAHLTGQAILQPAQQLLAPPPDGQQIIAPPPGYPFHPGLPPGHQGPPPHHLLGPPPPSHSPSQMTRSPNIDSRPPSRGHLLAGHAVLMPPPPPPSSVSQTGDGRREEDTRTMPLPNSPDTHWDTGSRRRTSPSPTEPDKKKMRGMPKNKHNTSQQEGDKELTELLELQRNVNEEVDIKHHPASPQYQGQPLRYPCMPSDPNLPPSQESGLAHQLRALPPPVATSLPPGHHMVHQLDPNMPPQLHIAHTHMHMEDSRHDGPPTQIVIEHPGSAVAPIHITHHGMPAPGQIHLEHTLAGPPPRQVLFEHPATQTIQIEHHGAPPGHADHVHIQDPHPVQPPVSQEIYEFDVGAQQVAQQAPQFHQTFEHITMSQAKQPGEQMLPPGSAVIVSSTQHFPHYSVAISSEAPPPPVSYALQTTSPFSIHSQQMSQHIQRLPDGQHISVPPPSYNIGLPPAASHYQTHFGSMQPAHPQTIQGHILQQTQQPPPPPPPVSQSPYQPHHQGISYWVSQA